MSNRFKKEVIKQGILLGLGLLIFMCLMFYWEFGFKEMFEDGKSVFLSIGMILYPLGITYGIKEILGFISGSLTTTREEKLISKYGNNNDRMYLMNNGMIKWCIVLALAITFGWIIGVVKAIRELIRLQKEDQ